MEEMREAIDHDRFEEWSQSFLNTCNGQKE
jgi:hypothetical protein